MMTPSDGGAADGADVVHQAGLVGFRQVRRQQQDALGAGGLGGLGVLDGLGGGAAGGGQDRHRLPTSSTAVRTTRADSAGVRREALARAAGGEQPGDGEAGLPGEVLAVVLLVELQLCVERR